MSAPELSRLIRTRPLPGEPVVIEASEEERAALAKRFGVAQIASLRADVSLSAEKTAIHATGRFKAAIVQLCAVSGEEFPVAIDDAVDLRFVRESTLATTRNEEGEFEVELIADECDEIEYTGDAFDLGEAIAQTLGLAIDPYAEGPGADAARKAAGISGDDTPSGPLAAALAALKKD